MRYNWREDTEEKRIRRSLDPKEKRARAALETQRRRREELRLERQAKLFVIGYMCWRCGEICAVWSWVQKVPCCLGCSKAKRVVTRETAAKGARVSLSTFKRWNEAGQGLHYHDAAVEAYARLKTVTRKLLRVEKEGVNQITSAARSQRARRARQRELTVKLQGLGYVCPGCGVKRTSGKFKVREDGEVRCLSCRKAGK